MIIEDLIRLGRPLLQGGLGDLELLELVSDVTDNTTRNFFQIVLVVELPPEGSNLSPVALSVQVWGGKSDDDDFQPDKRRALSAPFIIPKGGNPLNPQGRYGIPVYPCWTRHIEEFRSSPKKVLDFLKGRVKRTPGLVLPEALQEMIAQSLHERARELDLEGRVKPLAVLILARCTGEGAQFAYTGRHSDADLGASILNPGKFIVPVPARILDAVWAAKVEEGAEMGSRSGICSICGREDQVVSYYCKAWPWALPEWSCPLPKGGDEKLMVEGVALDAACYKALTLGAHIFGKLTKLIQPRLTKEIFAPAADAAGKKVAQRRKLKVLPTVRGSAFLLPIHDDALEDDELRSEFAANVRTILDPPIEKGSSAERYLDEVTGFELFLPEDAEKDDYRLTFVYFSGDPSRGNIHLRAFIQDVIPSTVSRLRKIARSKAKYGLELQRSINPNVSDEQAASFYNRLSSVPFILGRAYGGSYLWKQLESVMYGRPLDLRRPTRNAARRMTSLSKSLSGKDGMYELYEEVVFYLHFLEFLGTYNNEMALRDNDDSIERRPEMKMRPWKELLNDVLQGPVGELHFESPADLGFACGVLTRRFGRSYWHATKAGKDGKDFLKHRVMTFGSDLSPEVVWKRGMAKMFDLEARLSKLNLSEDFRQRVGLVLAELDRLRDEVRSSRDEFMSAFWSGYALEGSEKPAPDDAEVKSMAAAR